MEKSSSASPMRVSLSWIAVLRILVGLVFLTSWGNNLRHGFYSPDGLERFFTEIYPQSGSPLGFYAAFINQVILPNRAVFAPFQLVAEGVLSLALLVGVFTPFFSLAGIFFLLNVFLATLGHDWPWSYIMPVVILIVVGCTRAGRSLGVDGWLLRRYGEKARWLW